MKRYLILILLATTSLGALSQATKGSQSKTDSTFTASEVREVVRGALERNEIAQLYNNERSINRDLQARVAEKENTILAMKGKSAVDSMINANLSKDNLLLTKTIEKKDKQLKRANTKATVVGIAGLLLSFGAFLLGAK